MASSVENKCDIQLKNNYKTELPMSFANFAKSYDITVKGTQRSGLSELEQFGIQATQRYMQNASRIRDSRFANSRAFDMDVAMKENRERVISDTIYNSRDTRQLAGLHSRVRANLTRTGDSLANFKPSLQTDDLPNSLSDSSLLKRDILEIGHRAKISAIQASAPDAKQTAIRAVAHSAIQSVFDSVGYKPRAQPAVATATSRLPTHGVVGLHYAPPRADFSAMNPNERRQYQSAVVEARQRGLDFNSAEYQNFMARRVSKIKTNTTWRERTGSSAGALSTSPSQLKSGKVKGSSGVRNTKTKASVRKPVNERTQTLVRCSDCGTEVLRSNLSRHRQSVKCRNNRLPQMESTTSQSVII